MGSFLQLLFVTCAGLALGLAGCGADPPAAPSSSPVTSSPDASAPARLAYFRDATSASGVRFEHRQGRRLLYMPETTSPGVGVFDYDADGFEDVFFVQGSGAENSHDPARMPASPLHRNVGEARLEEVAERAGIASRGWGQACLAWDFDNDGYQDLMITHFQEPQKLFRNNGDGTFSEVAAERGVAAPDLAWASSLTAIDCDRDGLLDVYVGQYLRFEAKDWIPDPPVDQHPLAGPFPSTLKPAFFPPLPKRMYHARGDGAFEEVGEELAVRDPEGRTLGALSADLDGDRWPDLLVANDASNNAYFQNDRGRGFISMGVKTWLAENRGSMGISLGDFDLDGHFDIFLSNWMSPPALYHNVTSKSRKGLQFLDRAQARGLTQDRIVGWGAAFLDVDNDGREDLLQINGHTNPDPARPNALRRQVAFLWKLGAQGVYELVQPASPADPLGRPRVGRGAAFADLDHDGYTDVAIGNNNEPGEVWLSNGGAHGWIGLALAGSRSCRDATGSHVEVRQGAVRRVKQLVSGDSFYSANSKALRFGLGTAEAPVDVRVQWISGLTEDFPGLAVRRYHRLVEGSGRAIP